MGKSRTKKAIYNVGSSFLNELVKLICGLILPRLILTSFGSAYNGVVSSITQFISCIALMKAGIGGATKAALYKPLAEHDTEEINKVVAATQRFMRSVALIFVIFTVCFGIIYPLFINSEFDFWFTFTLILIVSLSTFASYFFAYTYQLLFMADQKEYILTSLSIVQTILETVVAVVLINNGFGIHIIKLGSVLVSSGISLTVYILARRRYKVKGDAKVDMTKIPGRWDAVAHEVATFVNNNTDVIVLTLFTNLLEVSVYSVYHYVIYSIKKIIKMSVANFASAFGDMYAKGEKELIEENLSVFELIVNSIVMIMHSVTLAMIVPFVLLYTEGVNDVNYARFTYACIAVIASAFDCFRMPYKTIVTAIGHFKQTRNGAIFEAVLNIVISCVMVFKFGLIGVAIGTLVAMMFRTFQYSIYLSKNVLDRSLMPFITHITLSLLTIFVVNVVANMYLPVITNWFMWIVYAVITTLIAILVTFTIDFVFYRKYLYILIRKVLGAFGKKKKHA